jgi:hypothetical protein
MHVGCAVDKKAMRQVFSEQIGITLSIIAQPIRHTPSPSGSAIIVPVAIAAAKPMSHSHRTARIKANGREVKTYPTSEL